MKEMIDARKQMNQARIDKLDAERFEYAKKLEMKLKKMLKRFTLNSNLLLVPWHTPKREDLIGANKA